MRNTRNADLMDYQIYLDSFGGTVWGDGVVGGVPKVQMISVTTPCVSGKQSVTASPTLFGQVFPLQAVSVGDYADTLTISIMP